MKAVAAPSVFDSPSSECSLASIAPAVQKLRDTFASGKTKDYGWRINQLEQIKKMTEEQQEKIIAAMQKDLGKCTMEAWLSELGLVTSEVEHATKHLKKWMKPRKVSTPLIAQPAKSYLLPEPLGTVLVISAWNYPYQLALAPVISAIAAGNCCLIKPSELAKNTSNLLAQIIPQYLDSDAISVIEGAVDETTELLKQQFDHIIYTGGETVGKIVMQAAAKHLTPVTLELGGKSPCIVDSSADIKVTAARIVWSKWLNAGQTCVAPDYVLVEKRLAEELIEAIKRKLHDFYGDDIQSNEDYGRIINQRHHARIASYLDEQNVIYGGQSDAETCFLGPTIVLDPPLNSQLMQEEIFGPVLPIVTLDNIHQAIPFINQRPKPLSLYVYTNESDFEQQVLHETSAGMVCVNDGFMFAANANLPFGGVGNSGTGAYHGKTGFDNFSHMKTVMKRRFSFDLPVRYPPYSKLKLSLIKKLL